MKFLFFVFIVILLVSACGSVSDPTQRYTDEALDSKFVADSTRFIMPDIDSITREYIFHGILAADLEGRSASDMTYRELIILGEKAHRNGSTPLIHTSYSRDPKNLPEDLNASEISWEGDILIVNTTGDQGDVRSVNISQKKKLIQTFDGCGALQCEYDVKHLESGRYRIEVTLDKGMFIVERIFP